MTREPDPEEPSTLDARLARVERSIATLSAEVAAIRAELGSGPHDESVPLPHSARPIPTRPAASGAPRRRESRRYLGESIDFERLLGRYGMLGIAVLAAAAAVGT